MRQPSIHITEENLIRIIEGLHIMDDEKALAREILKLARRNSCDNRNIFVTNEKLDRKVKKILSSSKGDAALFANIFFSVRKKLRHKGVRQIKQGHKEWPQIKELANVVNDFCNDFELSKREGYIMYIELGLPKISSPRNVFTKLANMYESIALTLEAQLEIEASDHKTEIKWIHDLYVKMIAEKTGIMNTFYDNPRVYIMFLRLQEVTDKLNIDPHVYLDSQFEGLAWTSGYPDPYQLISEKSSERLNKYMYENKLTTKKKEVKQNDFNSILKKIKDVDNRD